MFVKGTPNIFKFHGGSVLFTFLLPWFSMAFNSNVCAIFTHFLEKNYFKWIILERFSIIGNSRFFQIGIWDIAMTCTNIVWGQTLLKLLKLLGRTHYYKRVHDLIVWRGFLKYSHKLQGGMHLATQDAHLLNLLICF